MEIIEIPNKSAFKLNEVCSITGVKPYVLRFWESEFDEIEPMTSSTGQKLFGPKDIETIANVKDLLFTQKMSIEEARFALKARLEKGSEQEHFLDESDDLDTPPHLPDTISQASGLKDNVSFQRMSLSDSDLDKLVLAKSLLKEIVTHEHLH